MIKLNLDFLSKTSVDSHEITPVIDFYVPINKAGLYDGEVFVDDEAVAKITFRISNDADPLQADIDLNALKRKDVNVFDLRTNGYAVFFSQTGEEAYRVIISRNDEIVFDNTKLSGKELISVTLMTPGKYNILDESNGAKATVEILTTDIDDVSATMEAFALHVIENRFVDKEGVEIKSVIEIPIGKTLLFTKLGAGAHLKIDPAGEIKLVWAAPKFVKGLHVRAKRISDTHYA